MCSATSYTSTASEFESASFTGLVYCFQDGFGLYPLLDVQQNSLGNPCPKSQSFDSNLGYAGASTISKAGQSREEAPLRESDGKRKNRSTTARLSRYDCRSTASDCGGGGGVEGDLKCKGRPRAFAFCDDRQSRRRLESLDLHFHHNVKVYRDHFHIKLFNYIKSFLRTP